MRFGTERENAWILCGRMISIQDILLPNGRLRIVVATVNANRGILRISFSVSEDCPFVQGVITARDSRCQRLESFDDGCGLSYVIQIEEIGNLHTKERATLPKPSHLPLFSS